MKIWQIQNLGKYSGFGGEKGIKHNKVEGINCGYRKKTELFDTKKS